ncbi:hypothetical protein LIER_10810 [Lithospermum erythrorhizon]|uniref:Reverse transcriptase Ty1/copia-type domain-containing protein n=1 Tax=Lithospermum erythrorhizon TaxID=34254 RepID=A0AAV3PN09_LITER
MPSFNRHNPPPPSPVGSCSVAKSGNQISSPVTWIIDSVYSRRTHMNSRHNQESDLVIESTEPGSGNPSEPDLDLPIAVRKATKIIHLIECFVSYSNLSSFFRVFSTSLSNFTIPNIINETLTLPNWKHAVLEKMNSLYKNKWELVNLPPTKRTVGCKWVFTVKYNEKGEIDKYKARLKARLVTKEFTQTYMIDFSETFAPVAKLNTIRVLLSLAANLD